jgi:hypothetical protein
MWAMWTPILNWWRTSVGNYPTVYIYSILLNFGLYIYIVQFIHTSPQGAPLLALQMDNSPFKLVQLKSNSRPHFMQVLHIVTFLQKGVDSVKESFTIDTSTTERANSMKSADYDEMLNDTYKRAREARDFAEQLDMQNERKASLFWHEMADRLYAVVEHAEGV